MIPAASVGNMSTPAATSENLPTKPIRVGLSCWLWDLGKPQAILQLGQKLGVKVQLTQKFRGLRREIEAQVSGGNVDHFISEFVRQV